VLLPISVVIPPVFVGAGAFSPLLLSLPMTILYFVCVCVCVCIYIYIYIYMWVCVCVCVCVCACVWKEAGKTPAFYGNLYLWHFLRVVEVI
jgi:hypothetical protein